VTIYYPYHKEEFVKSLSPLGSLLCFDVGTKRIGIAVSDPMRLVASPLCVIHKSKFTQAAGEIKKVLFEYNPVAIVVGYPYEMNGQEGVSCQRVRHFCYNFLNFLKEDNLEISLLLWDERLSTKGAESSMLEGDLNRKNRAGRRDKIAACLILQGFLDFSNLTRK